MEYYLAIKKNEICHVQQYGNIYMYNLKHDTNQLIYKIETDSHRKKHGY